MDKLDLKPCPLCGKPVDYAIDIDMNPYGIHCVNCHMIVRFTRVKTPSLHEPYERVLYDIAARWNRREGEAE